jgi:hypothetical protein
MIRQTRRNRTRLKDIIYAFNSYFDDLSLRKTSKALSRFVKRIHAAIRLGFKGINLSGYYCSVE